MKTRIYLVGMPASGKTTVGKILAKKLNFPFIDTDTLIEQREKKSIPDIFKEHGEEYFRLCEKQMLRETLPPTAVISTGGGMPCFHQNMEFIKEQGTSVFMHVPTAILAKRAAVKVESRPLLQNDYDLVEKLNVKLEHRIAFYQQADFTINYIKQNPQQLSSEILEAIQSSATR